MEAKMNTNGKLGIAPCGCEGRHVIGNYVQCVNGCDQLNDDQYGPAFDEEKTDPGFILEGDEDLLELQDKPIGSCPKCTSTDIDWYIIVWTISKGSAKHCWTCGYVFV